MIGRRNSDEYLCHYIFKIKNYTVYFFPERFFIQFLIRPMLFLPINETYIFIFWPEGNFHMKYIKCMKNKGK